MTKAKFKKGDKVLYRGYLSAVNNRLQGVGTVLAVNHHNNLEYLVKWSGIDGEVWEYVDDLRKKPARRKKVL